VWRKYNFGVAMWLLAAQLSAVLDCTWDGSVGRRDPREMELRGEIALRFRTSHIPGWSITNAKLLIRRRGRPVESLPVRVGTGAPMSARVEPQPEGWVVLHVPPALAQALVEDERRELRVRLPRDWRVDSLESLRYRPTLFVKGTRSTSR
jgi:hypothetical protein